MYLPHALILFFGTATLKIVPRAHAERCVPMYINTRYLQAAATSILARTTARRVPA